MLMFNYRTYSSLRANPLARSWDK